jgi:hypothetical protein
MEKLIIVIYVGVQGIRSEDIEDFVRKVTTKILPTSVDGEFIIIPTQSPDTRIECINPKYITETELIAEHTELMKKLREELQHQLNQIKNQKDE